MLLEALADNNDPNILFPTSLPQVTDAQLDPQPLDDLRNTGLEFASITNNINNTAYAPENLASLATPDERALVTPHPMLTNLTELGQNQVQHDQLYFQLSDGNRGDANTVATEPVLTGSLVEAQEKVPTPAQNKRGKRDQKEVMKHCELLDVRGRRTKKLDELDAEADKADKVGFHFYRSFLLSDFCLCMK